MKTYDPNRIIITLGGALIKGYADGTFVSVERSEDGFELAVGAGGDVTRVRNNNRSGTVTLTLQAESPSNDTLSALALLDELSGLGVSVFFLKNLNGTTLCAAESVWIQKIAMVEHSDAGDSREWVVACADLDMFVGGQLI